MKNCKKRNIVKIYILLPIIFLGFYKHIFANQAYIDSLNHLIETDLHDTTRINLLIELGDYHYDQNKSLQGVRPYLQSIQLMSTEKFIADYNTYYNSKLSYCYYSLARIYESNTSYVEALNYYNKALQFAESKGATNELIYLYDRIAYYYKRIEHSEMAFNYIRKLILLIEELNIDMTYSTAYHIGSIYGSAESYDTATYYLEKALSISEGHASHRDISILYIQLGQLNIMKKEFNVAKNYLDRANEILIQIDSEEGKTRMNLFYSLYYEAIGQLEIALDYANKFVALTKELPNDQNYIDALQHLAGIYYTLQEYKKVIETYDLLLPLKDKYFNDQNSKEIGKLEATYLYEKELFADSLKFANQLMLSEIKIMHSKRQNLFLIILALLAFFGIGLYSYNKRQKHKIEIELKNLQAREAEELLEIERLQLREELLEKENLELELKFKEKDVELLLSRTDFKRKLRSQILETLDSVLKFDKAEIKNELKKVYRRIDMQIEVQEQFDDLDERIRSANTAFENKLIDLFPDLTKRERELCFYIRSDMSVKEIMIHKNISLDSVKSSMYRIRKKMNIKKSEELYRKLKTM